MAPATSQPRPLQPGRVQPVNSAGSMSAVIVAGGKGMRLGPYTTRLTKPLVPIGEEHAIMEIVLSQLAWSGFSRVTLAIGHLGELIRSYVGDGSRWGVQVDYGMPEEMPLGTMGPVLRVLDRLPEDFLVMNGDVLTDLDYADLMRPDDYDRVNADFGLIKGSLLKEA